MISVLCPSRKRLELLERSVGSLRDRATGDTEILIAADKDDPATAEAAYALRTPVWVQERAGYAGLHEYYAMLTALATGDWLMVWNDDATMMTDGWDAIIEALPAEVLVADVQSPHSPLCCFPAVRREAVTALGRFSTANPHVDTFWQDAGQATRTIRSVPVYASCESPLKPGQTHGYYDQEHQAELTAAIGVLRTWIEGRSP